ncbi:MAG: ribose-phosphate pyrophosphokinae [Thermoproteota archaeon]|nr:ribose-phosphate pyrophosphokinae [Thermoproteota archaeon]
MQMSSYVVFGEAGFSEKLANELQTDYIEVTQTVFPDREIKTRVDTSSLKRLRDKTALVIVRSRRYSPNPNDCVLKTLLVAETLARYEVKKMDLLIPYMFYARQDGERLPGESDSLTRIADLYEEAGFRNLITVNSHLFGKKKSLQEFFKSIKVYDLSTASLFGEYLLTKNLENPFVIGPGSGPERMVVELSNYLHCDYECLPKIRNPETGRVDMKPPNTNLKEKDLIIYDDIASSGGTTEMAYRLSETYHPRSMFIVLSHLWTAEGINRLSILGSQEMITTNSFITENVKNPFTELSITPLLAKHLPEISPERQMPLQIGFNKRLKLNNILRRKK